MIDIRSPKEFVDMKTTVKKKFDPVKFFRTIKEKLAKRMFNMSLEEQKEFLRKVKNGEIKIA